MLERLPSAFRELFPGRESSCGSTFRSVLDIFSFFSYWTTHMLFDSTECASLRRSLLRCVRGADPSTRVGFLTYAAAVAAYDLSVTTGLAAAEVLPGSRSPTPEDVEDLVGDGRMYVAPLSECADAIDAIVSSLRPASGGGSVRRRPRCLGPALETAVALMRHGWTGGAGGGRVVVCASGPATRGPGGVAADEDSELFDFEEKAAKEYVDELSITVSDDRIPLPVSSAPAPFGVQSHAEVR